MPQLSPDGQRIVNDLAERHGFSPDGVASMLAAVISGGGAMAQFNHPDFGGSGQWMRGGMTMVSDMFDNHLKGRVSALCDQLASLAAQQPDLLNAGGQQAQHSQGRSWWPSDLGTPSSTGAQNSTRYAWFAQTRRLAIDNGGQVTVYDTLDHQIGGVSQQQSAGSSLAFTSQHGPINLADLPVISGAAATPAQQPQSAGERHDIYGAIEKLAGLHAKGILNEEEFKAKKAELLARL